MANEKTPLLVKQLDEVVVKIPISKEYDCDSNGNKITTSLSYEELIPFLIDPSWIRLRKICFTSCWIVFFVILLAACISSHQSMSKMSCNIMTKGDNESAVEYNVTTTGIQDGAQGILSIVLNSINATVVT